MKRESGFWCWSFERVLRFSGCTISDVGVNLLRNGEPPRRVLFRWAPAWLVLPETGGSLRLCSGPDIFWGA